MIKKNVDVDQHFELNISLRRQVYRNSYLPKSTVPAAIGQFISQYIPSLIFPDYTPFVYLYEMLTALLNYLDQQTGIPLSEEDIELMRKAFIPRKFRKRQFLLQEGDVCKCISFIVEGAVRQYTVDEKGNEHVLNLAIENWWTSDRESYHKLTPSIYNIDAWEETQVLMLPKADGWYDKVNSIPAFCKLRIKLDDAHHMAMQSRLHSSISYTAESRYEELLRKYPDFLKRFPQHIIASYLGITKETLSRIRNQSLKK